MIERNCKKTTRWTVCAVIASIVAWGAVLPLAPAAYAQSDSEAGDDCIDQGRVEVSGLCYCPLRSGSMTNRYPCHHQGCNGVARTARDRYNGDKKAKEKECKAFCKETKDSSGNAQKCNYRFTRVGSNPNYVPSCIGPDKDTWKMTNNYNCDCYLSSLEPLPVQ